jgi:uncharacterized protein YndB with AHSA1/START domain
MEEKLMSKVSAQVRLPESAAEVWDRIGDFDAVPSWHPAIDGSRLEEEGWRRVAVAADGESVERLMSRDDVAPAVLIRARRRTDAGIGLPRYARRR